MFNTNISNNKRVAKNALMLYIRMLVMMGVNLYTSRVILQALGVEDFGLYNIVGAVVVLFSFISNAMILAAQRFLSYELGRGDYEEAQKVFSASLSIHIGISIIFLFIAETVGLWFLNNHIQVLTGRETAAFWVFQFSILTSIINIIRATYNAVIIAYERMSIYAYISILEAVLKLFVAFFICLFADRLIAYAGLVAFSTFIIMIVYYGYCRKSFEICLYRFEYNKRRYAKIASFSGWSLLESLANVGANQGISILLNMFFGVVVNAAMGIACQVCNSINLFVVNFQTAFNPQIVKLYASNERDNFINFILNTSRYSYLMLFILALPVYICCPEILQLWLGTVPEYSVTFCRLIFLFLLVDAIQGPLWISVQATGQIRNYQLLMSSLILLNLPITYTLFKFFDNPSLALVVKVVVNVLALLVRVLYLRRLYGFPIIRYMKEVCARCVIVTLVALPIPYILYYFHSGLLWTFCIIFIAIACAIIASCFVGISLNERKLIIEKINTRIKR